MNKKLGLLLLSIWLILNGLTALTTFRFHGLHLIMSILVIVSGILIIVDR
jgi:hypothetical protein